MKQTAVEWLGDQIDNLLELYPSERQGLNKAFEQAKEMEKEQMSDKKFSEEDMKSIFEYGWNQRHYDIMDETKLERIKNRYIQSLQQNL
jgi:hypothetical protein